MVAVAPGLILTSTINWDMWAVALAAVSMLAWARRYPVIAGALLGLAVAAKFYPIVLVGPLFILCLRARRLGPFFAYLLAGLGVWLALNLPLIAGYYDTWIVFYRQSRTRGADLGSIWLILSMHGHDMATNVVNRDALVLMAVASVAIAVLALVAPRRPRFPQLAFLVLVAFVLVNKVYSPQYVMWLIPLAVLARPRWRDFLIWQACEVAYFVAVWWYLQGSDGSPKSLPAGGYHAAIVVHVAGMVYLSTLIVRDIWWPYYDPVRADGADDPAGGPLDGAPDRITIGLRLPKPALVPSSAADSPEDDGVEARGRHANSDLDLVPDGGGLDPVREQDE
jgi:uncharacterized membrane protein